MGEKNRWPQNSFLIEYKRKSRHHANSFLRKKNNYIAKSFKMRRELADELKATCDKAGVSQSGQIVKMMQDFILISREKDDGKR